MLKKEKYDKVLTEEEKEIRRQAQRLAIEEAEKEAILVIEGKHARIRLGRLRVSHQHLLSNKDIARIQTVILIYLAYSNYKQGDKTLMLVMILLYFIKSA